MLEDWSYLTSTPDQFHDDDLDTESSVRLHESMYIPQDNDNESIMHDMEETGDETDEYAITKDCKKISVNFLKSVMHIPLKEVASMLRMSNSNLKKICRRLHIYHWPARQIMSLQKTVDGLVNSIASGSSDVDLASTENRIATLRQNIAILRENAVRKPASTSVEKETPQSSRMTCSSLSALPVREIEPEMKTGHRNESKIVSLGTTSVRERVDSQPKEGHHGTEREQKAPSIRNTCYSKMKTAPQEIYCPYTVTLAPLQRQPLSPKHYRVRLLEPDINPVPFGGESVDVYPLGISLLLLRRLKTTSTIPAEAAPKPYV
mmetsp:Transcript_4784/g.7282  ORF Transcript_4784/g.7282 Transcript_4784/m.7282 type:complete len:319 (+) Transcript_4784:123-1079(+)|eukprot:CAMPEP_0185041092 /NCGR_PEP_ID=MMETSP1103-20130426/39944_1 /TAXON_ID=36769 /ORGANISM="Paraphysomonas bandaiensis, Strain Caron Lab Isolate" /LENGTH=318 /DNA_ID=CAMNT_0027580679 /DNA_START=34 /DNA_END=990 /DNA_ORIENTATION=-